MATSYAPSTGLSIRSSIAPTITRLYLVSNGTEYEFRTTAPGTDSLVENAGGELEVDPLGTAKVAQGSDLSLIVY